MNNNSNNNNADDITINLAMTELTIFRFTSVTRPGLYILRIFPVCNKLFDSKMIITCYLLCMSVFYVLSNLMYGF